MTLIYEDGVVQAHVKADGACVGHVVITPKTPAKYMSELPDNVVVQLWYCASFAATAVFEGLGAHGTNILCYEGESLEIHVLARVPEDGLGLRWDAQRKDPSEIAPLASTIKEAMWYVGKEVETRPAPAPTSTPAKSPPKPKGPDHRVLHLRRRP